MKKLLTLFLALSLLAGFTDADARKQQRTSASVKKEKADAKKKVGQTQAQIRSNEAKIARRLNDLNLLQSQIEAAKSDIKKINDSVAALDRRLRIVEDSITAINKNIALLRQSQSKGLRQAREMRQSMSGAAMVFAAPSLRQAARRLGYLKQLEKSRASKTKALATSQAALDESRSTLARLRTAKQQAGARLVAKVADLEQREGDMRTLVADLRRDGNALNRELERRKQQERNLDLELARLIEEEAARARQEELRLQAEAEARAKAEAEARAKAEAQAKAQAQAEAKAKEKEKEKAKPKDKPKAKAKEKEKPAQPKQVAANKPASTPAPATTPKPAATLASASQLTTSFLNAKGRLPSPVAGSATVVRKFGRATHENLSKVELQNNGIDIQTQPSASALAVHPGVVSSIFTIDGFHNIVMVRHGEYLTVYAGLDALSVKKGDTVSAGSPLGKVYSDKGDGGRSILHFEVRHEREKLNPAEWLAR